MKPRIFGSILVTVCMLSLNAEKCPETENPTDSLIPPSSLAIIYCDAIEEGYNINDDLKNECKEDMIEYFKSYLENENDIEIFARKCGEKMKEEWKNCKQILVHLKKAPLCWTLESAVTMINILDKDKFLTAKNYKNIKLKYKSFQNFPKANMQIDKCMDEINAEIMDAINIYMEMWSDKMRIFQSGVKAPCTCVQVFGIYEIYRKRSPSEDAEKNELKDLYKYGCFYLKYSLISEYWTKDKLQIIADDTESVDFMGAKKLLVNGTELLTVGFLDGSDEVKATWTPKYVLQKIESYKLDSYWLRSAINLLCVLIRMRFSSENFDQLLNVIVKFRELYNINCISDILQSAIDRTDNSEVLERKEYWLLKNDKRGFIKQLNLLMKLFFMSEGEHAKCSGFKRFLFSIENMFYMSTWSEDHFNYLIQIALSKRMQEEDFRNCLSFSFEVEELTKKLTDNTNHNNENVTKLRKLSEEERIDFRKKLFSNVQKARKLCDNIERNLDIKVIKNLLEVYQKVFSWGFDIKTKTFQKDIIHEDNVTISVNIDSNSDNN